MPDITLTSRRHPLVTRCRDAADGHGEEVLLDGPHLVLDALAARTPMAAILVSEGTGTRAEIATLIRRATAAGLPVHAVTPAVLDAASPTRTPSGVVALATLSTRPLDALLSPAPALVAVAIDVQDPGNLGTMIRSSEAAGATGLLALGATARPFGWRALRGSMGSALRLPVGRDGAPARALASLRERGVRVVALTPDAPQRFDDVDLSTAVAVCAGAEGAGLSDAVLALTDQCVSIPMRRPVESLNVGVATSLVLFEAMRQRERQPRRPDPDAPSRTDGR